MVFAIPVPVRARLAVFLRLIVKMASSPGKTCASSYLFDSVLYSRQPRTVSVRCTIFGTRQPSSSAASIFFVLRPVVRFNGGRAGLPNAEDAKVSQKSQKEIQKYLFCSAVSA